MQVVSDLPIGLLLASEKKKWTKVAPFFGEEIGFLTWAWFKMCMIYDDLECESSSGISSIRILNQLIWGSEAVQWADHFGEKSEKGQSLTAGLEVWL